MKVEAETVWSGMQTNEGHGIVETFVAGQSIGRFVDTPSGHEAWAKKMSDVLGTEVTVADFPSAARG